MHTVLIVDDEPLVRVSVRHIITENIRGVNIVGEAGNGVDALALYEKFKPQIMITDIKMPVLSGLGLISRLREQNANIETIIISGYSDFEYARQAIKFGVTDYVLKPIKATELKAAIEDCIKRLPVVAGEPKSAAKRLIEYIDNSFDKPLSMEELSAEFSFSSKYLSNLVKNETGKNFTDYITDLRIKKAIELLTQTDMEIKLIAGAVGYADQQYFHRIFKKKTGQTPSRFRGM